jgi:phosphatidate cytidylyltransferase
LSPPTGFGANLLRRVATALVALPLLLALLFFAPAVAFVVLAAAVLIQGMRELLVLLAAAGVRPARLAAWSALAAFFVDAATAWSGGPSWWPIGVVAMAASALGRGDHRASLSGAAAGWLGAAYLGGLGGAIVALRLMPPADEGAWRVVLLLAAAMVADTAAFFVGHALGRTPLAPGISPGKTVEGALGGLFGGALAALAVRRLGLPQLPALDAALLGVAVAALGVCGDLFESRLKRWTGAKDSGRVFPGHGGVLDRLDSLLLAGAALYYYFWLTPNAR